mgnify:CR=1 FL=1
MSQLFSDTWMNELKNAWNQEADVFAPLEKANFSANIAYGYKGEEQPRGILTVVSGKITRAGAYAGEELDWDLRASPDNWQLWLNEGFGLSKLGPAVAMKKLQFATGNYRQMIRNPALSHPFLLHFDLMRKIPTSV